jgi:hypothetical protein
MFTSNTCNLYSPAQVDVVKMVNIDSTCADCAETNSNESPSQTERKHT